MKRGSKPRKGIRRTKPSTPPRLVTLKHLRAIDLHPEVSALAGGWACPHMLRRLAQLPERAWGEVGVNWSIGPLRNWSASTPIADPVVLCARCTKKRNLAFYEFTIGDIPTSTHEEREAYKRAIVAGPPPLEAHSAKAGGK